MRQNERGIRFIRVGGAVAASTAVGLPDNQGEPTLKVVLSLVHFYSQGTRSEMGSCGSFAHWMRHIYWVGEE